MASTAKLQLLKSLREVIREVPKKPTFQTSALPVLIPQGAVTELCGAEGCGKTESVLKVLAENPEHRVAWVEDTLSVYPFSFPQRGVSLARVLFVEAREHLAWAALQLLRSRLFRFVIIKADIADDRTLKRLQIAAEQGDAALLLLSKEVRRKNRWPVTLQVYFKNATNIEVTKGGTSWMK